jgi:oligosaccharyltransferase complex subunit beta
LCWQALFAGRGFQITYESPKSEKLALFELGERAYDHVLLLPAQSKGYTNFSWYKGAYLLLPGLGPKLTPQLLLKFINEKGNILLALDSSRPTPTGLVSLLLELNIHLPADRNTLVVDHFNYDTLSASEKHDVVLLPRPGVLRPDVRNYFGGHGNGLEYIAFPRGVGQVLGNDSPLLAPVLRAPRTAYSYNPKDDVEGVEDPFAVGQQLSLVSVMQARNSARFTVIGAAEMLEDKWFDAKVKAPGKDAYAVTTSNRAFAKELSGWTFNEIGVVRVGRIEHYLTDKPDTNETNPKIYRVKNTVVRGHTQLTDW